MKRAIIICLIVTLVLSQTATDKAAAAKSAQDKAKAAAADAKKNA